MFSILMDTQFFCNLMVFQQRNAGDFYQSIVGMWRTAQMVPWALMLVTSLETYKRVNLYLFHSFKCFIFVSFTHSKLTSIKRY